MSDFEYFGTIGAFVAGFMFLLYLFRIRAKIIKQVKLRMLEAKAKLHYMTRPNDTVDVWGNEATRKRDIR